MPAILTLITWRQKSSFLKSGGDCTRAKSQHREATRQMLSPDSNMLTAETFFHNYASGYGCVKETETGVSQ
jgi:hypothetical protein